MTPNEFIEKIGEFARQDMKKSGILASLTIAQAILESGWGKYDCGGNNLFGIKGEYNGQFVECPTKEYYNGQYVETTAHFRKYPSWLESLQDHSDFLLNVHLGDGSLRYQAVIGETDYKKACQAIKDAGYATSPVYAQSLINLIEQYNLNRFDVDEPVNPPQPQPTQTHTHNIGEHIVFSTCYNSSTDSIDKAILATNMTRNHGVITRIIDGSHNPYLLDNGLCWVNDGDIREVLTSAPNTINVNDKVTVTNAIQYNEQSFNTWGRTSFDVMEIQGDKVRIGDKGVTTCWININNIKKI